MDPALDAALTSLLSCSFGMAGLGWIWIVGIAFSNQDQRWGMLTLVVWPLAIIYGMRNIPQTKIPLLLLAIGVASLATVVATALIIDAVRMS